MQGGDEDLVAIFKLRRGLFLVFLLYQSERPTFRTVGNVPGLEFVQLSLCADFVSATRTAAAGAAGHLHLPSDPINVQVMLLQPGVAHDHFLTAQACHGEEGMFQVVLVSQDQLHYLRHGASFIQGAIHITDGDWARKGLGREAVRFDIRTVNEHPGGPGIQEHLHCSGLSGVSGLEFNV